jgi:carbamoyl-phosphate synthase large subunit
MEVVFNEDDLRTYMTDAVKVSNDSPVLLDRFLDLAIEGRRRCDLRRRGRLLRRHHGARRAGGRALRRFGLLAAAEQLERETQADLKEQTRKLARALKVVGLMNIQFAIQNGIVYILEVNPRASRTVPFVSKATGVPLAKMAARVMTGSKLKELGLTVERVPKFFAVKESVFPFTKFPEADPILGPEMKSTGEVMGTGASFGEAYAKAQLASGVVLPTRGVCLISVRERDKPAAVTLARRLVAQGFEIVATSGTAKAISDAGIPCRAANKVREGRPHIVDMIKNDEISLIVNTTEGKQAIFESRSIRREAVHKRVTYYTTVAAGLATCDAIAHMNEVDVNRLQDLHQAVSSDTHSLPALALAEGVARHETDAYDAERVPSACASS